MTQSSSSDSSNVGQRMRARFQAARDAGEPVGLLRLAAEHLGSLAHRGTASPEQARQLLRAMDRLLAEHAARVDPLIGALADGRLVLVVGLDREGLELLARDLVHAARQAGPDLSIGVAHDQNRKQLDFETLAGVADAGLEVAQRGGGRRMVHTDQYEWVARHLVAGASATQDMAEPEPEPESSEPELAQVDLPRPPAEAPPPSEEALIETLRKALSGDEPSPALEHFHQALDELLREHPEQDPAHEQVELLERRVNKLAAALTLAESEIARLRARPAGETGVASVYREVQGLNSDEPLEALKRELMAGIYAANVALQGARDERGVSDEQEVG